MQDKNSVRDRHKSYNVFILLVEYSSCVSCGLEEEKGKEIELLPVNRLGTRFKCRECLIAEDQALLDSMA